MADSAFKAPLPVGPGIVLAFEGRKRYNDAVKRTKRTAAERPLDEVKERRLVAMHLQHIEDNPLTVEEIAMFEMFERENWSHDRRLAYIRERSTAAFFNPAAE